MNYLVRFEAKEGKSTNEYFKIQFWGSLSEQNVYSKICSGPKSRVMSILVCENCLQKAQKVYTL